MAYGTRTIEEFLAEVASEQVVPAGGSTAAVVGATGAALCEMVCIHSAGSAGEGTDELARAGERLARRRSQLLGLADADAGAVRTLLEGGADRERALKRATGVPLTIAEACLDVLELAVPVTAHGTEVTLPDARSGVLFAEAALRAAVYTVRANLDGLEDPSFVADVEERLDEIEPAAERGLDRIHENLPGQP